MENENEKKEAVEVEKTSNLLENNENIFEEYLKPRRYKARFWVWVAIGVAAVIMIIIYKSTVIDNAISPQELKASIQLFNLDSQWVEKEKIDTKEFKGILLVPQISFQVRNVGKIDIHDVYFLGVFRLMDRVKTLGEGFETALKKPLKPGEKSERITLTCQFGYKASSKIAFKKNSKEWRTAMVQIFAKTGTTQLLFLKTFYISRKIEGLEVEFKLTDKPVDQIIDQSRTETLK